MHTVGPVRIRCLAVALLAVGCGPSDAGRADDAEAAARQVEVEPVRQETVQRTIEVVGTLAAEDEVTVSSQVARGARTDGGPIPTPAYVSASCRDDAISCSR